jgi:putative inorganic carbon (hco3(-)) transporter
MQSWVRRSCRAGSRDRGGGDVAPSSLHDIPSVPPYEWAMHEEGSSWSWAPAGVVLASCVVVPCIFWTRIEAVFVVPKLAALWAALAIGLVLVAVGVVATGRLPRGARWVPLVDVPVAAFVALGIAAWAFSTDREQSLYGERLQHQGLLTLLLYVGFFYLVRLSITDQDRLRLLSWAVAAGATLVAAYALVQKAGLDPIWEGFLPGGRVFSSIGQANALAAYLVLAIPLSIPLVAGVSTAVRAAVLVAIGAMTAALVLTQSRGGFLGFLAAAVVFAIGSLPAFSVPTRRLRYVVAATLIAVVVLLAATASAAGGVDRLTSSDSSIRFHLDAWRVAAQIAVEHPLLGTGPETFPDVFPRYSHDLLPADRANALDAFRVESPHEVYLGIAAGSGIPALAAYLAVIAGFFVVAFRGLGGAARDVRLALVAALAAVAGHLVTDAFMSAEVTSTWLFWVVLGAVVGVVSQPNRQSVTFHVSP